MMKPGHFKRTKIVVTPLDGVDYPSRVACRLAWESNTMFGQVLSSGEVRYINRDTAHDPMRRIGEVSISFDKGRQGIVVKIPPLTEEERAKVLASAQG